ncbi:MAG: hypothetical protein GX796_02905 [Clostridiaceae bacterium]|nr:hypothetical protein [Clostridiaceae bacterium]
MDNSVESSYPCKVDILAIKGGHRVTFYCSAGDKKYTIEIYDSQTVDKALKIAWDELKKYFNRCHQYKAWVCDEHYNEDVMKCVLCQPK